MVDGARAELIVEGGPGTGRTVTLGERPVTLGRESFNDIVVDEPTVSRVHALATRTSGRFVLRDLNTTNGTYLDNEREGSQGRPLKLADTIRLANSQVRVTFRHEEISPAVRLAEAPQTARITLEPVRAQSGTRDHERDRLDVLHLAALALAHHVRNAVSPIIGWAELMESGTPGADIKLKEVAVRQGHKVVAIVDALIQMVETGDDSSVEMRGPGSRKMLDLKASLDRIETSRPEESDG